MSAEALLRLKSLLDQAATGEITLALIAQQSTDTSDETLAAIEAWKQANGIRS